MWIFLFCFGKGLGMDAICGEEKPSLLSGGNVFCTSWAEMPEDLAQYLHIDSYDFESCHEDLAGWTEV